MTDPIEDLEKILELRTRELLEAQQRVKRIHDEIHRLRVLRQKANGSCDVDMDIDVGSSIVGIRES